MEKNSVKSMLHHFTSIVFKDSMVSVFVSIKIGHISSDMHGLLLGQLTGFGGKKNVKIMKKMVEIG